MNEFHQHNTGQNNSNTKENKFYTAVQSQIVIIWVGGLVTGNGHVGGFWSTDNALDLSEKTFATLRKCKQSNKF